MISGLTDIEIRNINRPCKLKADWTSTLTRFAYPVIGKLPPSEIDTHHALRILKPIWKTKTVAAVQVRERIEKILDAAKVDGLRTATILRDGKAICSTQG